MDDVRLGVGQTRRRGCAVNTLTPPPLGAAPADRSPARRSHATRSTAAPAASRRKCTQPVRPRAVWFAPNVAMRRPRGKEGRRHDDRALLPRPCTPLVHRGTERLAGATSHRGESLMAAPRSKRRRFDDDGWEPTRRHRSRVVDRSTTSSTTLDDRRRTQLVRPTATRPRARPRFPSWVVTDPRAIDTDHGVMKTGKEADVSLLDRRLDVAGRPPQHCLLAAKRYRSAEHRMFHRDAGYLEGRRVKESREIAGDGRRARRTAAQLIAGAMGRRRDGRAVAPVVGGRRGPVPRAADRHRADDGVHRLTPTASPRRGSRRLRPDRAEGRDLYHADGRRAARSSPTSATRTATCRRTTCSCTKAGW